MRSSDFLYRKEPTASASARFFTLKPREEQNKRRPFWLVFVQIVVLPYPPITKPARPVARRQPESLLRRRFNLPRRQSVPAAAR
jgi:hypothetical protein